MGSSPDARTRTPRLGGTGWLSLVAAALVALAAWVIVAERASFEAGVRTRLSAQAQAEVERWESLGRELVAAAQADPDAVAFTADGTFLRPEAPRAPSSLELASHTNPEGAFYLEEAERIAREEGDVARARSLYGLAAAADRAPRCRAHALLRLAALERRQGNADAARRANEDGLALVPTAERLSREALLARALARPVDDELAADLARSLGFGSDPLVEGLLREAELGAHPALTARRRELARMARARRLLPLPADRAEGLVLQDDFVLGWARSAEGELRIAERAAPVLSPGVEVVDAQAPAASAPGLAETAPVGALAPGLWIAARLDAEAYARERTRRLGLFQVVVVLVALAGIGAVWTIWRAVRRESEAVATRAAFVARVGHDLRTPLAVMRMYAETLSEDRARDPAERRAFADIIVHEAERLSSMVHDVLDLERLGQGDAERARRVDLTRLVCDVADVHAALFREAGYELVIEVPDETLTVHADEDALRGAIGNLLENTLHHGVHVALSDDVQGNGAARTVHLRLTRDGERACLEVLDRGPGLPAGDPARLFVRFVRGPDATGRGAGLGLALVREVAEAGGGTVEAGPREGGGARFVLRLPVTNDVEVE